MGGLQSRVLPIERLKNARKAKKKVDLVREMALESNVSSIVEDDRPLQLVLYGPGEAGKTTFAHKMMLIHGHDLSVERQKWRPLICFNIVEGVFLIVKNGMRIFKKQFRSELEKEKAENILRFHRIFQNNFQDCSLDDDEEMVQDILYLYNESKIFKLLIKNRSKFALFDSWLYFMEKLEKYPEWGGKGWNPSNEDILHARVRSVGAKAFSFYLKDKKYTLTDLGGQKSERQLRLVFTLSLDCLLFFVSLADYDEVLFEDHTGNRLTDSLRVWKECVSNKDFENKTIILFLNKLDLFQKKYFDERKAIKTRFQYNIKPPMVDEEEGDRNCPVAINWFKELYMNQVARNKQQHIKIFVASLFYDDELESTVDKALNFLNHKTE